MAKRELPQRSNRGKNKFYSMQIQDLKEQKTSTSVIKTKKRVQREEGQQQEKKQKLLIQARRQIYNENKKIFRYTRGIHYFYQLEKLQRLQGSISYAVFPSKKQKNMSKNKNYTITFSKDKQLIGNTKIQKLINRNYIGLPKHQQNYQIGNTYIYNQKTVNQVIELKRNDKNQCHHYLFQQEDKKHNLDRMIKQLQFIYKKIDYFLKPQNLVKLKKFSIIQKDNEMSQIFFQQNEFSQEQKIQSIKEKISYLYEKRQKLNVCYQQVSQVYLKDSLDQKLFNQIKKEKQKLNRFQIYQEMQSNIRLHKQKSGYQNNQILMNYHNSHIQEEFGSSSELDEYFCIDQKCFDNYIMDKVFKIISIRLFHEGQNCFYFGKRVFLRLFNIDLKLQKQIKNITFEQYLSKIKQIEEFLEKYSKKQNSNQKNCKIFLQNHIHQKDSENLDYRRSRYQISKNNESFLKKISEISIRINQKIVPIQFYEYYCLKAFKAIHDSLLIIKQLIKKWENKRCNLIQVLASLYYPKLQNRLLTRVQNAKFGILIQGLDKLVDLIAHKEKVFQPMNYQIFVQFSDKKKQIVTFVREVEQQSVSDLEQQDLKRLCSISQWCQNEQKKEEKMEIENHRNGRKRVNCNNT